MSVSLSDTKDGVAILQVHRPQVRNAMNWQAMEAFAQCVEQAYTRPDLRVLIVAGSTEAFIAGGDLKELAGYPTRADGLRLSRLMGKALNRLEALPAPTIAAMNGPARGGGTEIALACDLRVMASDADFGLVQITLGLTPGWGAGQRLLRLAGYSRAFEWLITGRILTAQEALAYGLANRLAPPGKALEESGELARLIASLPQGAVRGIKYLLRAGMLLPPETAAAVEGAEFPPLWADAEHLSAVTRFLSRK
jgi:enoyl-CoA hydratase/carnithine racemase